MHVIISYVYAIIDFQNIKYFIPVISFIQVNLKIFKFLHVQGIRAILQVFSANMDTI